ncbi:MAG: glucose-1-phosphate adenylyltransferase [Gammaproteobacteria bacterium]|nr:glucose-1-phosphate adenylyltransferase [Gammaproteobacteria bacterium]
MSKILSNHDSNQTTGSPPTVRPHFGCQHGTVSRADLAPTEPGLKYQGSPSPRVIRNTLALVLAGGRGVRLKDLTQWRTKPAVHFGGKFRIIDFTLSNCINSGIRHIGVLTQYKAHSLIKHIQKGWGFLRGEFNEFVELLPAQQRIEASWYTGTADAIYQNLDIIRDHNPALVLILAGDHVYKADYGMMINYHIETNADVTVGCIDVPIEQASQFGVMAIDSEFRVTKFVEKPAHPEPKPGSKNMALVSMGIYLFDTGFLSDHLTKDANTSGSKHDFGKDIIPSLINEHRVIAYPFSEMQPRAYWRDVGTVDAYYEANMELIGVTPELNLYDMDWPIWAYQPPVPPAKFVFDDDDRRGMAVDSMVAGGCIISGATVRHSILFSNVRVGSYTVVQDSVVMPEVVIEKNCHIEGAIIDRGCYIPEGTVIGRIPEQDEKRFYVTPNGVVLITPEMLGQELHHVR